MGQNSIFTYGLAFIHLYIQSLTRDNTHETAKWVTEVGGSREEGIKEEDLVTGRGEKAFTEQKSG